MFWKSAVSGRRKGGIFVKGILSNLALTIWVGLSFLFLPFAAHAQSEARCHVLVADGQFGRIEICVSSVLSGQSGNRYGPDMAADGNLATAWVEAAANDGTGQWIEYIFDQPLRVQTLEIVAGYAKSASTHSKNARPSRLLVLADDTPVATVPLRDTRSMQTIRLKAPVEASIFRLKVASVYPGAKWQDMAISELYVDLEEHNLISDTVNTPVQQMEPQKNKAVNEAGASSPAYAAGMKAFKVKDYRTAFNEWIPLAKQGHANAQNNLGFMFTKGLGATANYTKALHFYRLAADQGLASAQFNLGYMYENGMGVADSTTEAMVWYRLAAAQGYAKAINKLKETEAAVAIAPASQPQPATQPRPAENMPAAAQPAPSSGPSVEPTLQAVFLGNGIDVRFSGLPANGQDWLAIAGKGQGAKQYFELVMLENRPRDGVHQFKPLPEGEYEIRLYTNWPEGGYNIVASSKVRVVRTSGQQKAVEGQLEPSVPPPVVTEGADGVLESPVE